MLLLQMGGSPAAIYFATSRRYYVTKNAVRSKTKLKSNGTFGMRVNAPLP